MLEKIRVTLGMPRPFTRRKVYENARFLEVLAETRNARLAAREVKACRARMRAHA